MVNGLSHLSVNQYRSIQDQFIYLLIIYDILHINYIKIRSVTNCHQFRLFGLSKERPILDHHPKAHIHEIRRISRVKSISKDQLPGMVSPMFLSLGQI